MIGYVVQADGSCRGNPGPAGIGVAVIDARGGVVLEVSRAIGTSTNNQAEYCALIVALLEASRLEPPVVVQVDSELVCRQLEGRYRVRDSKLKPLHARARALLDSAPGVTLKHVSRKHNSVADRLAQAASNA